MANQDDGTPKNIKRPAGTIEEQRQRRAEALKNTFGMWKDRTDIPKDGVEYQEQIRSEWDRTDS
jgi:hypothetical protein